TKTPAEIDFFGSIFLGLKPCKAIFELKGDRLKLGIPSAAGLNVDPPRPTGFQTDPQSKTVVLIYRREASAPGESNDKLVCQPCRWVSPHTALSPPNRPA